MPGQFDLQPNFPIQGVAQLLADRSTKEAAMRAQQQAQLVDGLKTFGSGVQSLVDRRNAMAQALAQAHIYAQTPEGQALMAPKVTQTPVQTTAPASMNGQDFLQGLNSGAMTVDGQANPPPPTSTPSDINEGTFATAFRNEQPGNFMSNLMGQANQKRQLDMQQSQFAQQQALETQKEANARYLGEQRLKGLLAVLGGNLNAKDKALAQTNTDSLRQERSRLVSEQATLNKQMSGPLNAISPFNLAGNAGSQYKKNQERIDEIDQILTTPQKQKTLSDLETMTPQEKLALYNQIP